ncbi:MAG: hypothetical protein L3J36_14175 [Rhodobacteraceae bacterium]|nr:hypothetical protein [Paracoccaceae bacterium]
MTYKIEMQTYISTLDDTIENVGTLGAKLEEFSKALKLAGNVVKSVDKIGELAHTMRNAVDAQLTMLKLTKLAGPLKVPSKVLEKVLDKVKPVVDKIDDTIAKLNGKKDGSGSGDDAKGEFLEKLSKALDKAGKSLGIIANELEQKALDLHETRQSMAEFVVALDHADFAEFDALKTQVEAQIEGRNIVTTPLAAAFNDVTSKVNNVLGILSDAEFDLATRDIGDFADISALMDKIGQPMEAVAAILKPIEWLLDSVGFVVDLVLGPIFDFITKTLGIDKLLDSVADDITALLPDGDFLEPMLAGVQDLLDTVRDFNVTAFGINDLQLDIDARIYGATVGDALLGPTGIGDDSSETLVGDSGDDLLDARGGDDIVQGGAGNDIIVAGEGNDRVFGGAGTDMVYFAGFFNEYELAKDTDGKIIVTHVRPAPGKQNEGSTRLDSIEHVVFANIAFTGAELENSIIGGSVLNGTNGDDLMFLNSDGTRNTDGRHVANGLGGDDRIFGSTEDDELNGGTGNDVLIPGLGDDEANGGSGSDSYQVLDTGHNNPFRVDLAAGTVFGPEGRDLLNSIENLIIQGNGDHLLAGSAADNNLLTAGGDDIVAGRDGDDFFNTGQGRDVIITGAGRDRVLSGDHHDLILATSLTVAGEDEFFDGGRGYDILSYSSSLNEISDLISLEHNETNEVKNRLAELTGSTGSLRIDAATGTIEKLDASGQVISTDTAVNFQVFVGSDFDDVITGGPGTYESPITIHGGGGDDTLLSQGANQIYGGSGDDLLVLDLPVSGQINGIFHGGSGHNILDLRQAENVRWWLDLEGSISRSARAFEGDFIGNLRSGANTRGRLNMENINEVFFADGDHLIENDPLGSITRIFHTGNGDDQFFHGSGYGVFNAGGGDDYAFLQDDAMVLGGDGDDRMVFDHTGDENEARGGNGNDWITLERFGGGTLQGGKGYDTLVFDTRDFAMTVDLKAGTATDIPASSFPNIGAQIQGFERVIGSEFSDTISGAKRAETLIGREGNDLIKGRGANDQLFGGSGNDTLEGGNGDDRLHGGAGNDILKGGKGRDTAVYSYAEPGGTDAEQMAGNFGNVVVNLMTGQATGSFGTDTLAGIEDVASGAGHDILTGDAKRNVLSSGAGNDELSGMGGNDVLILGVGDDMASGGDGADRIITAAGIKQIDGGSGNDRLEFGPETGQITLDFNAGSYSGMLNLARPVWQDTGSTEARQFNGVSLTPQQVRETQAIFANDASDLARILPDGDDPLAGLFRIVDRNAPTQAQGVFSNIENVVGGNASMTILLSAGFDGYDGTRSDGDILDFSVTKNGVDFNIATGATDYLLAQGDDLQGIDGIIGGVGGDRFVGDAADNTLRGHAGNDVLLGENGADLLLGGAGRDTLNGGQGRDVLKGGAGRDVLRGDGGADQLNGGAGNDKLIGGLGADSFVYAPGGGRDRIVDFQDGIDQLDLRGFDFANVSRALNKASMVNGDAVFDFGNGNLLVVEDTTKSALSDDILI